LNDIYLTSRRRRLPLCGSPQLHSNSRQPFPDAERLGGVIVGAPLPA